MSYATLVGLTLVHDGAGTAPFYTPPIARQAQEATFTLEATHVSGSPTLVATVQHKNFADTGWTAADVFDDVTATGVKTLTIASLKEEIRLAFTFSAGSAGHFVHVVVPEPVWNPE